jgi:cell wall-associated NlpC family hydrolase
MPRALVNKGWRILQTERPEAGDLVFLGDGKRKISHVALALSSDEAFHASWKKNGSIETWRDLLRRYSTIPDTQSALNYSDPRSSQT